MTLSLTKYIYNTDNQFNKTLITDHTHKKKHLEINLNTYPRILDINYIL